MDNEMGYLPLPGDKATESQSLWLHLPACLRQREEHYVCYGPCGSKRGERRQGRRKKRRKIQIWKWSLALQTDRKFCLTDDGCSGRGVAAVIKQFIAPDAQLGDTCWTSLCAAHKPPESGSTEKEGNRQTEGEEKWEAEWEIEEKSTARTTWWTGVGRICLSPRFQHIDHEHSWLQMTQVPSANRLFGATHISHRFLIKRYAAFEWPWQIYTRLHLRLFECLLTIIV